MRLRHVYRPWLLIHFSMYHHHTSLQQKQVKKAIEKMRGGKKVENTKAEQNYEVSHILQHSPLSHHYVVKSVYRLPV